MKKSLVLIILAAVIFSGNDAVARQGFQGGGGGFILGYMQANLDEINNQILSMGIPKFDDGFFLYGGRGFGFVNDHIRIGGMGMGGRMITSGFVPGNGSNTPDLAKEVEFSMGYGGVTLEYVYDAPYGIQVFTGGLIGWGGLSVRIAQYESALNWNGIWDNYGVNYTGDSYDLSIMLDNCLFILNPWIGAFYNILPWMGVSGQVGYFYSTASSGNWDVAGSKVLGGPDLDLSNLNFEFSILFGG